MGSQSEGLWPQWEGWGHNGRDWVQRRHSVLSPLLLQKRFAGYLKELEEELAEKKDKVRTEVG